MTMIERAARALEAQVDLRLAHMTGRQMVDDGTIFPVLARAVLQAIREPTVAMVMDAVQQVGDPSPDNWALGELACASIGGPSMNGERACAELIRDWQAMIDRALEEG